MSPARASAAEGPGAGSPGLEQPFADLGEFLAAGFCRYEERTACISFGVPLSYRQLERESAAFAAWLQSLPGIAPGERVALVLPNCLQFPIALFGLWRAGLVGVLCNPLYTARELHQQLRDSGARVAVVLENFAATLVRALPGTRVEQVLVTGPGDALPLPRRWLVNGANRYLKRAVPAWRMPAALGWGQALETGRAREFMPVSRQPADPALLQYTGGTTGLPKGAVLTHGNLLANVAQARAWAGEHLSDDGRERVLSALPLHHIFGLTANCLFFFSLGGSSLLITNPRDLGTLLGQMRRHPCTVITGVNTLFQALLDHPAFAALDWSRLRLTLGGGMATRPAVAEAWQQRTGVAVTEAYGLTEASPAVSICRPGAVFTGSIGQPLAATRVEIRDDSGIALPDGALGEICVAGPQVMAGYWQQPGENALAFWPDGFLRTGDLGCRDESGCLWLKERCKDMILVSGFNVFPREVEEALAEHADVLEAGVVGLADVHSGETVLAFVVPRPGAGPAVAELIAHCRERLAPYKVPHQIRFVPALPKNLLGKIQRQALRDQLPAGAGDLPGPA